MSHGITMNVIMEGPNGSVRGTVKNLVFKKVKSVHCLIDLSNTFTVCPICHEICEFVLEEPEDVE